MSSGSAGHGDEHLEHIQECLELAAKARGDTGSNPLVGAVVVASGAVIGRGYHRRCGDPHAEQVALVQAGGKARGGTLYTNVEPCCHQGRTPPCVDAIIAAGVGTVVASHSDPDERVDGRGFEALRTAGIEVLVGPLAAEAAELNAAYLKLKRTGRPLVVAKAAVSLDGRMATRTRGSQWITGEEARDFAHQVRGTVDAVVGGGRAARDASGREAPTGDRRRAADRNYWRCRCGGASTPRGSRCADRGGPGDAERPC